LRAVRRLVLTLAMIAATALIGWVDDVTGADYGMSLFYLGPVAITAWFVSMRAGVSLATVASIIWFVSELRQNAGVELVPATWNGVTRLIIYVTSAVLLALLRADRARMRELLAEAERSARSDSLTGLANSRAFHERLEDEVARMQRHQRAVTIAYIDIDNFKGVNDRYGHPKGDEVLREIADALRTIVRAGDVPARLGGDEFAVALWETPVDQVQGFERRLRDAVVAIAAKYPGTGLDASVGFAELGPDARIEDALRAADQAMYAAKAVHKGAPTV
jgi:diguanylate cyclase (GGDEF)-like protein